jgi:hypothetical protein
LQDLLTPAEPRRGPLQAAGERAEDVPVAEAVSPEDRHVRAQRLTIRQTPTGYWTVQRGAVQVAFAMTRRGAEAEREMLVRLARRSPRRAGDRRTRA